MKSEAFNNKTRITIGSFDGIHLGHQMIINQLVDDAHKNDQQAFLVSFFPNPIAFFQKNKSFFYLSTQIEKELYIKNNLGIDKTIVLPFDEGLSQTKAEDFIHEIHSKIDFDHVYIGFNFLFGKNRKGNPQLLQFMGKELGFSVHIFEAVEIDNKIVSSSLIRNLIQDGSIKEVRNFLGRNYSIMGEIVHGDGRGKKIGFPTANIEPETLKLLPFNGIYAARINIGNEVRGAAVSIGVRPTFIKQPVPKTIEAYIFDWDKDIYGQNVILELIQRIRDEIEYEDQQALSKQIEKDIFEVKEILKYA